jgi:hypothetical protein
MFYGAAKPAYGLSAQNTPPLNLLHEGTLRRDIAPFRGTWHRALHLWGPQGRSYRGRSGLGAASTPLRSRHKQPYSDQPRLVVLPVTPPTPPFVTHFLFCFFFQVSQLLFLSNLDTIAVV